MDEKSLQTTVRVWDLPVRICHWGFALLLPLMWWTAEYGEMGWHKRLGIVLLALLVFRILWGFVGSSTARFASFVKGPRAVWNFIRGFAEPKTEAAIGHSPIGGWSTVLLLGVMLLQSLMGLFAGDPFDGSTGPLNHLASVGIADKLTDWHELFFYVVAALAAAHVAAIVFYLTIKKDDLVTPMVTGLVEAQDASSGMDRAPTTRAIASFAITAGLAIWIWFGSPAL